MLCRTSTTGQGDQLQCQCLTKVLQKQLLVEAEAVVNIAAVVDIAVVRLPNPLALGSFKFSSQAGTLSNIATAVREVVQLRSKQGEDLQLGLLPNLRIVIRFKFEF